jgi:putative inorganic carbon (hco3(-)) transporter
MSTSIRYLTLKNLTILAFIVLIVLTTNMQLVPGYIYSHDAQRFYSLILLAAVLTHSAIDTQSIDNLLLISKKIRFAFYCLLALAVSSTALSHYPRHAVIEVTIFASLCYLALFSAGIMLENKAVFIKRVICIFWISTLLYLFGFYVGYITAYLDKTPLKWPQPFFAFFSIRCFNQYQLWLIGLITLPLIAFDIKQSAKYWLTIALTFWWVLLFYSASRGVLVAWFIGMVTTAIIYKKLAWPFLKLQMTNISTGFVAYYLLFRFLPNLQQQNIVTSTVLRGSTSDRIELWDICLKMMEYHPFVGVGPMHYYWYTKIGTHPHNSVLQLGAEWGVPATLIMLSIAGYGFYRWCKKFNVIAISLLPKLECDLSIILFFTIITNAAYSLVDGVITMPISQVLMFTIIGMMIGQYQHGMSLTAGNNLELCEFRFRPIFACIVLIALVWSNLPEIIQGLSGNPRGFSSGPNIVNPRIWVQPGPRSWENNS